MYFVQNENWVTQGGFQSSVGGAVGAAIVPTLGVVDIDKTKAGGGLPNPNWALLQ